MNIVSGHLTQVVEDMVTSHFFLGFLKRSIQYFLLMLQVHVWLSLSLCNIAVWWLYWSGTISRAAIFVIVVHFTVNTCHVQLVLTLPL